ncbi:cytochrome c [Kovacikia minuta CCNUW1]|uniref:c-type cytochrome n=1 Tax=Kovacikia minuta TaxID=2931930 RepID=UPI001CCCD080|nr:c-type cytochrome [Kovacikia minuta]UBF26068.1 cytochrome c [Kovacikia minuta CCNUW1]
MDNQLATKDSWIWQTALAVLAIFAVVILVVLGVYQFRLSDPYVRNVLSLSGNPVQGHEIFQMNCAGCHGTQADGRIGPSLLGVSDRKSKISLIQQVISGQTPPMPQFQPNPQEMADLLSYLESL